MRTLGGMLVAALLGGVCVFGFVVLWDVGVSWISMLAGRNAEPSE